MELMEIIATRRSVRRYREDPVPRQILEELLTAACWAPSAENQQPWYFVALTGEAEIARLHSTMEQVAASLKPHLEVQFPRHPRIVGGNHRVPAPAGRRAGLYSGVPAAGISLCAGFHAAKRRGGNPESAAGGT